jgi:hypothetical protein
MHVASVYLKCFRCFRGMFQLFHTDVAKVDQDVAYVAMVIYVRCKRMSPMFHLFFQRYVASVFIWDVAYISHICCKCFIWMFAYVCNDFQLFLQVFQMHVSSVSSFFFLYVVSVASRCFKIR